MPLNKATLTNALLQESKAVESSDEADLEVFFPTCFLMLNFNTRLVRSNIIAY